MGGEEGLSSFLCMTGRGERREKERVALERGRKTKKERIGASQRETNNLRVALLVLSGCPAVRVGVGNGRLLFLDRFGERIIVVHVHATTQEPAPHDAPATFLGGPGTCLAPRALCMQGKAAAVRPAHLFRAREQAAQHNRICMEILMPPPTHQPTTTAPNLHQASKKHACHACHHRSHHECEACQHQDQGKPSHQEAPPLPPSSPHPHPRHTPTPTPHTAPSLRRRRPLVVVEAVREPARLLLLRGRGQEGHLLVQEPPGFLD